MVTQQSKTNIGKFHWRKSTPNDIVEVAENMRQEDIEECFAHSGSSPVQSLFECFFTSNPCMTMISRHGNPMGMWGIIKQPNKSGQVWMLGCKNMLEDSRDKREFLRQSRIELKKLHKEFPVLFNYIDARNTVHLRWLTFMGFTIIRKHETFGYEGRPFYEFVKI